MHCEAWERAKFDLDFARRQARTYHDAQVSALRLSKTQRTKIRAISEFLTEHLLRDADGDTLISFLTGIAEDVHPEASLEDTVYFLAQVEAFLPNRGHPANDGLRSAVFWLMLNYAAHNPDRMGVGVGEKHGGTQKANSKLVDWLEDQLTAAGIRNGNNPYVVSAVATAARKVKTSDKWCLITREST